MITIILTWCPVDITANDMFKIINNDSGLPDNSVNAFCQDERGFVWIATANGLCYYDGVYVNTFRHDSNDSCSISGNNIHRLLATKSGVYVETDRALDFFSFATGQFIKCTYTEEGKRHLLKPSASNIIFSKEKIYAVGSDGRIYYAATESPTSFFPIKHEVTFKVIASYLGDMIIGAGPEGIYLLSGDDRKIISGYKMPLSGTYRQNLYYSHNTNMIYLGNGFGNKSYAFNVVGNRIEISDAYVPGNLMMTTDYERSTVFAVDGSGLIFVRNNEAGSMTRNVVSPENSNLTTEAAFSVFVDNNNNLWAGTYRGGICQYMPDNNHISTYTKENGRITHDVVTAIVPVGDMLYVGLDGGGLNVIDSKTGSLKSYTSYNSNLPGNNIISSMWDGSLLWMGIYSQGLVARTRPNNFTTYVMPQNGKNTENDIWSVRDDGCGNVWVIGDYSYIFNKATATIKQLTQLDGENCSAVAFCDGKAYVSSPYHGLYVFDIKTHKLLDHYKEKQKKASDDSKIILPSNRIKYMYIDSRKHLWMSDEYRSLHSLDLATGEIKSYGVGLGLTYPSVTSIIEDGEGFLWMGTFDGLFRYNPNTDAFMRFDKAYGISSVYTYGAAARQGDYLYFGSTKGMVRFMPKTLNKLRSTSKVCFMAFQLINGSNERMNLYGDHPHAMELEHDQNFFTISFTKPEINLSGTVLFSYYLDGFDKTWRTATDSRSVTYTNVPPGSYDFYVRSTDIDGKWMEPSVLHIVISPPWWLTSWAIALWVMIIIACIVAIIRGWHRNIEMKHKVAISEIERASSEKLNEVKMDFYTRIVHELRTPVFLISAQIEEMLNNRQNLSTVVEASLQSIFRSSLKLNGLINRAIDYRKMGKSQSELNLHYDDVVTYCRNLTTEYVSLLDKKNISFYFYSNRENILLQYDADKLSMILSNLISNAFKYTNEGGKVTMKVMDSDNDVLFSVEDNGIGIIEKMRTVIFESFFRTERGKKQSTGDGIGLSVVKSLVELHGGKIHVDSEVNKGSVFTFNIPKSIVTQAEDIPVDAVQQQVDLDSRNENVAKADVLGGIADENIEKKAGRKMEKSNPIATHTVLIVDDEREIVDLISHTLSSDFKVIKAYNADEGYREAMNNFPEIIIADIMMGNTSGLEMIKKLKADAHFRHTGIIVLSARSSEDDMITAMEDGADDYLVKPVSLKMLRKRIDLLLTRKEESRPLKALAAVNGQRIYNKEEKKFLAQCRKIIDDNIGNDDFNIDFLAKHLAMSHSTLYKKIKTMTGMSLIEFINDYKIFKAVHMFNGGATNIEKVGQMSGFKDVKNFRDTFRRKMGMTPKQYIQGDY